MPRGYYLSVGFVFDQQFHGPFLIYNIVFCTAIIKIVISLDIRLAHTKVCYLLVRRKPFASRSVSPVASLCFLLLAIAPRLKGDSSTFPFNPCAIFVC
jgi:hypothetical protein